MSHTYTNLLTHIIFSTKERTPFINDSLKRDLHACLGGIVRELRGTALRINGAADHVHLLVGLPASLAVADALRVIKTNSSRWMHEQKRFVKFGWQEGYGAFSVSRSNAAAVSAYIERQEEHHHRLTFREEFIAFLRKHGVEYDEENLWR
jgi:putative transposase